MLKTFFIVVKYRNEKTNCVAYFNNYFIARSKKKACKDAIQSYADLQKTDPKNITIDECFEEK